MARINYDGYKCIICGLGNHAVSQLFFSKKSDFAICKRCIKLLNKHTIQQAGQGTIDSPQNLYQILKEDVVGQDKALQDIAVTAFKHIVNVRSGGVYSMRSNMLLIGDTGTGKTYTIEKIANILKIPFLVIDCSTLTATGYVGDDPSTALGKIIRKNNGIPLDDDQPAIIFLDEIDKLANSGENFDVNRKSVQSELLKALDGGIIDVNIMPQDKRAYFTKTVALNTNNILFVAAGCFHNLIDRVKKITAITDSKSSMLTISAYKNKSILAHLRDGLTEYGLMSEFVGRFPVVAILNDLTKDNFITIAKHYNGRIKKYIDFFNSYSIEVRIEENIYAVLAEQAFDLKMGARGIAYIVDRLFHNFIFNIKTISTIHIKEEDVAGILNQINIQT